MKMGKQKPNKRRPGGAATRPSARLPGAQPAAELGEQRCLRGVVRVRVRVRDRVRIRDRVRVRTPRDLTHRGVDV